MPATLNSADQVVRADLDYIRASLAQEWARLSGRRLLITGGAGFLGYYLVQAVTHFNQDAAPADRVALTVFDNFSRGRPEWLTRLAERGALVLSAYDLRHPLPADLGDFQYIIHGASIASPIFYRQHPVETMDGNVSGLRNFLEYAMSQRRAERPVEGLLFFSSSEIYGDPDPAHIPTPEDYRGSVSCTGPRACYDESKRYGETLCYVFGRHHGLATRVARPFNNYGPGLKINDGRVIPDLARDLFAGKNLVLLSDGSPKRTFCYTADAIVGYYKVLTRGGNGEAYNIGIETPEISIRELAEKIVALGREFFGYTGKAVFQPPADKDYLVDNPNRRCPVIAKARRELGFSPSVTLDDGLRRSLVWYQGNQNPPTESWKP